jgi:hypothetical protein
VRTSSRIAVNQLVGWGASLTQGLIGLVMVPFLLGRLVRRAMGS